MRRAELKGRMLPRTFHLWIHPWFPTGRWIRSGFPSAAAARTRGTDWYRGQSLLQWCLDGLPVGEKQTQTELGSGWGAGIPLQFLTRTRGTPEEQSKAQSDAQGAVCPWEPSGDRLHNAQRRQSSSTSKILSKIPVLPPKISSSTLRLWQLNHQHLGKQGIPGTSTQATKWSQESCLAYSEGDFPLLFLRHTVFF